MASRGVGDLSRAQDDVSTPEDPPVRSRAELLALKPAV
jgi:hypothetical protein